jgi:hypothetical protein
MTPNLSVPQPSVPHLTLDPATTDETLATIFAAQRRDPDRTPAQRQSQQAAALALIATLRPRDPLEAAYATRAAAAHYGSMECCRRAVLPDLPDNAAIRWHGKALALSRMSNEMVRTLKQFQAATLPLQSASQSASRSASRPAMPPQLPSTPVARQAPATSPRPPGRQDPMPSEHPSSAQPQPAARPAMPPPPTLTTVARPTAATPTDPPGRLDPMSSERPPPRPTLAAVRAQLAAALVGKPIGRQDPLSSDRPSFTPSPCILSTWPAATSFLPARPHRQSTRSELLGTTADTAAMLVAAQTQI